MYGNLGPQRYREADISSMAKEKILVLLYEKTIADLQEAAAAAAAGNRLQMTGRINHAMRIVTELRSALDHSAGGQIADNLDALYDFIFRELLEFLADCDARHAENSIQVLDPLLDAWRQIPAGTCDRTIQDQLGQALPPRVGPIPASPGATPVAAGDAKSLMDAGRESGSHQPGLLCVSA
jgi:flagellar protein FliS